MRTILASLCLFLLVQPATAADDRTTRQNAEAASAGIEAAIGEPTQTSKQRFLGEGAPMDDDACHHDTFCEVYAATDIQVQATVWEVVALTSSRAAPTLYRSVCAGILAGLGEGNVHPEAAAEYVNEAFTHAATQGSAKGELGGVEVNVRPDLGGSLLECSFWRRW